MSNASTVVKKGFVSFSELLNIFRKQFYRPPTAISLSKRAAVNLIFFTNSSRTGFVSYNELLK